MCAMVATRANIAFPMNKVSQFISKANRPYWMVVKYIIRYKDIALKIFMCSDWARDENNGQSCTRFVFIVGNEMISWKCKKQPTIALSTMEAQYMVTSHCTREAVWLRQLLANVGYV